MGRTLVILLVMTSAAMAQPSDPKVEAKKLFDEGRALATQEGKFAEACDKFAKSLALDKAAGTELNLGDCHEHLGHLADSWHWFTDAAKQFEQDKDTERANFAHARADAVLPRLGTVEITIADPTGVTLTVHGRVVPAAAKVVEHVDPGTVEIHAVTAGKPPFDQSSNVAQGETVQVAIAFGGGGGGEVVKPVETGEKTVRRASRVHLAYLFGGVGVTGVAVSVLVGIKAHSDYQNAIKNCTKDATGQYVCDTGPFNDAQSAGNLADLGTVVGIIGVALVATGAVMYLTAPKDVVVAPMASASGGGVTISGHF